MSGRPPAPTTGGTPGADHTGAEHTAVPDAGSDPLSILVAIDRLTVGPVRLEPRRVRAPYVVEQNGERIETELSFSYREQVFTPGDQASENLAALVVAQVAMNYGLFCREIVFHGPLDAADQRFIRDMTENTSREIYVNKFLIDNPFLLGDAARLPVVKRRTYTAARLLFPDAVPGSRRASGRLPAPGADAPLAGRASIAWPGPAEDPRKVAVLSSGGKDSLLSFGLLREAGFDVHPFFGNESGRHWHTALNTFRRFEREVPNTARVWMSSDRVFPFMARRLPFVRKDVFRVRADIYPIRLWTVAVFLFAVLPLVRKRGIGRVVIGNEYDTTRRVESHGIPHYDGLFDQSRFFDETLTAFYRAKGMAIEQFSVLRPVSELLVQQILAARYPDLHADQVSCHSGVKEGDRVVPCGTCEKCRRIVGMLVAGGYDPAICGYRPDQVAACLTALETRDLHQAGPDAEHLVWLLARGGHVKPKRRTGRKGMHAEAGVAREHPEVGLLRFEPECSPIDGIPPDVRKPLFRILLEHVPGAVERRGRSWVPIEFG